MLFKYLVLMAMTVTSLNISLALAKGDHKDKKDKAYEVYQIKDVETLNDHLQRYSGKKIQVSGNVENRIDSRSIVLESGGLFDNEIVVITSPKSAVNLENYEEDAEINIKGTLVLQPVKVITRDYSWDLAMDDQQKLRKVKAFLLADEVTRVTK